MQGLVAMDTGGVRSASDMNQLETDTQFDTIAAQAPASRIFSPCSEIISSLSTINQEVNDILRL